MCDLILPPSPQWYCSKIIDYNKKGILIFGTRHDVFVLDASSVPPTYVAQCCLHKERISSVALNENNICCSASEDGKVKVWKIDNPRDAIDEHNIHSSKIGCICWSSGNSPVVVSGDDRGQIVCWQYEENRTICYCPEAAAIVCLVCSNLNETQVAVGYRTGVVLIVDMREWKEGQVLQRLRGHDDEVLCLAWCPIPGENFKAYKDLDNPDVPSLNGETNSSLDFGSSGHLLVSSSRDRTIRVWSSARGRQILVFKPPKSAPAGREDKAKMWMTLLWNPHNANQIYTSSYGGEILRWSLESNSSQKPESLSSGKVLYHTRPVFCMSTGGSNNSMMCTVSMDRQMIFWDLSRSVPVCALPTLGGFVYVAKTSPVDPGRLAIGVGDSMIRLWNMNNVNNPFDVALLWQGIRSKVTALCWHPEKEGRLGFGTDDGRVGVFDTLSNKPPFVSSHYHRRTVYVVAWGPPCSEVDNDPSFVLYSVGDGIIMSHDPKNFQNEAQDINSLIFKTNGPKPRVPIRSEISWNPDFSLVAIGNDDGSVEIYKPPVLKLLCVVHIHHKLVNSIQWHPVHNVDTASSQRFYIAMGSNEATIQVVDLSSVLGRVPEKSDSVVLISEAKYTLFGHSNRIIGLQWSPHNDNKLVSVSFDGSARVWEVSKGQTIASYHGHRGRLLCVQWSGSDPDVVFTGGEDFTLHKWRISKNPHSVEDDALRKKKLKSKGRKKIPRDDDKKSQEDTWSSQGVKGSSQEREGEVTGSSVTLDTETQASLDDLIQRKKAELGGTDYKPSEDSGVDVKSEGISSGNTEPTLPIIQQREVSVDTSSTSRSRESKDFPTKELKKKRLSKPKSLFPLCGRHENRGKELVLHDIVVLTQTIYEKSKVEKSADNSEEFDAEEHISLGFYLPDRRAILQCLGLEGQYHKDHENMDYYYQLEIWKGNINGVLRQAREREELSDWLVAMAPMAAFDTWMTVCEDYATQLEQEGQYHKAATYLLASHKVYSAIDLFKRHRLFKEAIALAKVRLSPIDPVLEDLYTLWAHQLTKDGNFEQAAKCHLAMQQVQNAAVLLARRYNCTASLHTAARISMIANEKQSGMAYAHKLLQQFLLKWEWSQAYTYLKEQKAFQALIAVSGMHELVAKAIQNHHPEILNIEKDKFSNWQTDSKLFLPDFILDNKDRDTLSPWKPWLTDGLTFPHYTLRVFYSNLGIVMDTESLEEMYKSLSILQAGKQSQEDILQLLIQISVDLVLCMLSFLMSETPTAISHLIHAISSLQEAGHYVVMETVIRLFLPLGPKYMLKLQQEITAMRVVISMENKSNYDGAAKVHTIKRYLTEIKDEDSVSCGGLRCRELDCLRAYYYLAILNSLNQQQALGVHKGEENGQQVTVEDISSAKSETATVDSSRTLKQENGVKKAEDDSSDGVENNQEKIVNETENKESKATTSSDKENTASDIREPATGSQSDRVTDSENDSKGIQSATCESSETKESSTNDNNVDVKVGKTDPQSGEMVESPKGATASDFQRQCSDSERTDLSQLMLPQLCHLSRGLLWDIQGKRYALMETLGYIHKAISQLLLAQKPNSLSSSQTDIHSETKAGGDFAHGHEERDILPGGFPRQSHCHSAVMKKRHHSEPLHLLPGVSEDVLSHFHHHNHNQTHFSRSFSSESQSLNSTTREHLCPAHSSHDSNTENSFDICVSCEVLNKSRKVLWEDEPHLGAEHSGKANLTNLINPAKYINVPDEWYNMSADQKYSMPYVTMAILKDEQEYMMHELKRGPDNLQVPFPNPLDSVKLLLNVSQTQLKLDEVNWFAERVVAWALKFSVSAQQKENLMDLLHRTLTH